MFNLLQLLPEHLLIKTGLKLETDDLLNIEKCQLIDSYDVIELVFKLMRHLRIYNEDFEKLESVILRCGQNLKSVVVYSKPPDLNPVSLSPVRIRLLARQCPNLEQLPSRGWRKNILVFLYNLNFGHPSKLRKFYFEDRMTIDRLSQHFQLCPHLEQLQLGKWSFLHALGLDFGKLVAPSLKSILVLDHIKIEGRDLIKTVNELKSEFESILTNFDTIDMIKVLKCRNIDRIKITEEIDLFYDQLIEIYTIPQASKIVVIKYPTDAYWDLWKIQSDATNSIEQISLSKNYCNYEFIIGQLTNGDGFRNLKILKLFIRYDCETLHSMIRLIQIRGHTIRTLDFEPTNKSLIYENQLKFIENILEYCSNLKTCKLEMSIDDNNNIEFDHDFYRRLYSIRVHHMSYFKLTFKYGNGFNYWKSVDVLQGMVRHTNKMIELEMRDNVYQTWKPPNVNELKQQRDIDQLSTEEFWRFIEI